VVDQHGRSLRLDALRGRPALVGFVFTRCGNERACPLTMRRLVSVQQAIPAEQLQLVVFTLDPAYDTPERLSAYAERFGADPSLRLFTGDPWLLREGLPSLFNVMALGEGPTTSHPVKLTLVRADGTLADSFDDDAFTLDALQKALEAL
jgi:protein SCO1/2